MKFSVKDFFSKCDQIKNISFCAVLLSFLLAHFMVMLSFTSTFTITLQRYLLAQCCMSFRNQSFDLRSITPFVLRHSQNISSQQKAESIFCTTLQQLGKCCKVVTPEFLNRTKCSQNLSI